MSKDVKLVDLKDDANKRKLIEHKAHIISIYLEKCDGTKFNNNIDYYLS